MNEFVKISECEARTIYDKGFYVWIQTSGTKPYIPFKKIHGYDNLDTVLEVCRANNIKTEFYKLK